MFFYSVYLQCLFTVFIHIVSVTVFIHSVRVTVFIHLLEKTSLHQPGLEHFKCGCLGLQLTVSQLGALLTLLLAEQEEIQDLRRVLLNTVYPKGQVHIAIFTIIQTSNCTVTAFTATWPKHSLRIHTVSSSSPSCSWAGQAP